MSQNIAPELDTSVSTAETILAAEDVTEDKPTFDFDKFGFEKSIVKSIRKEGFTTPTPIQDMSILSVMAGVDLMGIAQTGSGKTAAFSLPTMNKLLHDYKQPEHNKPKVLIIAPTRELVMQIGKFIDTFSRGTPIKSLVVAGGQPYQPQIRKLKYGVDILIATPGRLIDHMGSGTVKLDDCQTFILDEADRMLDMGFIDEVKEMQAALNEDHQTVMFSATMNAKVRKLSGELLKDPEYVEQQRKTMVADTVTHKLMNVRRKNKADLLIKLLNDQTVDKALVFARTKLGADHLCGLLKEAFRETPIRVDAIHGDKKQRTREKILLNFRKGRTKVLVATDVAARGIDVDGISHVINYELPIEAENYVHRVGRTGRAGQSGLAISFCDPSDVRLLKEIERLIKLSIEVDADHKYHFDISEMREFKKGGKGKFTRNRSQGRFSDKRGEKRSDFKKTDRNSRRPERTESKRSEFKKSNSNRSEYKRPEHKRSENKRPEHKRPNFQKSLLKKPEGKRYEPWLDTQGFDDDPVLQKLRNKPTAKKKKSSGDAVTVKPKKKEMVKGKQSKNRDRFDVKKKSGKSNGKTKQTGGHKAFSPKRKTLKPTRAA